MTTSTRYTCRMTATNVCGSGDAANRGHLRFVVLGVEIRAELYEFLIRLPQIIDVVVEIDM
jgi:hypothetical protein